MNQHEDGPEVVGAAETAATGDPFWSVVRRRHPDVDVVVLPQVPEVRTTSEGVVADPETVARQEQEILHRTWDAFVEAAEHGPDGPVTRVPPVVTGRWLSGSTPDRIRREVSAVVEDPAGLADPTAASALMRRAEETLRTQGWHVLTPSDGLPRLMAGRPEGGGRREVLLLHAPAQGRLVVRVRGPELVVGQAVARDCVAGG